MKTIETRLKDCKGHQVWKMTDDYGKIKEVVYMLQTPDGDNLNCFKTLKELKKWASWYLK